MIAYFDKKGEIHAMDDQRVVDINFDGLARAIFKWVRDSRDAKKQRRLPARKKGA